MIAPTLREPLCDIRAQFLALLDPAHPKDAMWISDGTPCPITENPRIIYIPTQGGVFLTNNPAKAEYFRLTRGSEGTLAAALGYVVSKSELDPSNAVMVQATDLGGAVITEMACGKEDLQRAVEVLRGHGRVSIVSIIATLARRAMLVEQEDSCGAV
jgi:hypothetical protein